MIICIDVGNTHTHFAFVDVQTSAPTTPRLILTRLLDDPVNGLAAALRSAWPAATPPEAVAFCSVVPKANGVLAQALQPFGLPLWQLTSAAKLGLPISYPRPTEVGHDRLANAAGAHALVGSPCVVIDLGTAVTFDVMTRKGGYEGGIIAPGPALMTRYLHERTAQLPLVEDLRTPLTRAIGRSTAEAMRIGAVLGFAGLIQSCLTAVVNEMTVSGETDPVVLTTGGAAELLQGRLDRPFRDVPDLTVRGIAQAWLLSTAR